MSYESWVLAMPILFPRIQGVFEFFFCDSLYFYFLVSMLQISTMNMYATFISSQLILNICQYYLNIPLLSGEPIPLFICCSIC